MTLRPIPLLVLIAALAPLASARPDDPITIKLTKAAALFTAEETKFRKAVLEALDRREDEARRAGNKKLLDAVKADLKTYEATGELPKSVNISAAILNFKKDKLAYETALAAAVRDYTKGNMDELATATLKKLEDHRLVTHPWRGSVDKRYDQVWTFTRNAAGTLCVSGVYQMKGKQVGEFSGKDFKMENGKLKFNYVLDVSPNPNWAKESEYTVQFNGDKITYDYKASTGLTGSRDLERSK